LKVIGNVPEDPQVREYDLKGKPLTELPENSAALKSTRLIKEKLAELVKVSKT
jgi:CO dehydrogenase nickel-insertion accessory protein CooC1